ncbi:hypothetical protein GWI33_006008 [Rhynchophorus ferrugineus]|uniref:Uncharacterized protein n=1 Tax=Rhynchophorus ferrugineus TaxID=354439 RepID=A0A834J060_RHYFE|nr:hypothetical protein GWI33_006008 [Rhynchophorus ferrugineus]
MLNVYDWKHLKDAECLIEKPSFTKSVNFDQNFSFQCDLCESIKTFEEVTYDYGVKDNDFIEKLIQIDRPVKMNGGIEHWIRNDPNVIDVLLKEDEFASSLPCKINSNIHNNKDEDFVKVKSLISKTMIFENFFLQFQNCEKAAIRIFRNVTSRPSILPDNLSPVTISWLLWSKKYSTTRFKRIDLVEKYTVIGQIKGGIILRLLPRKNCQGICHILEGPLLENQFIVLTSLWDVEYRPFQESENLGAVLEIRG